jgi:hypothetical protein
MGIETHSGRLVFSEGQVDIDDGTVLAVPGPNPLAAAAGRFAKWGQTQPVTVTGNTGTVDNSPVLYVTNIDWAAQASAVATVNDFSIGAISSVDENTTTAPQPAATAPAPQKIAANKKAARKSARSRPKS